MDDLPAVAVVDDAPEVRSLLATRLRMSGRFRVVAEGGDGEAAIEIAARHKPELMLLDVSMPRLGGLEALPAVLAASPTTRVVMYSGFEEGALESRAKALGAAGFCEKSAPLEEVVDTLGALVPGGAPADGHLVLESPDEPDRAVLSQHLERFREVFEEAAIGMATMTLTGQLVRTNAALAAMLGRRPEHLVGVSFADLAGTASQEIARALPELADGTRDVALVEDDVDWRGAHRRVLATFAPVRDSGGRALYLFVQCQDLTPARSAEEALRRSEERFRLLVEAVQDYAIFMLDTTGHVASWNVGAQRIKGYAAHEIIGRHFRVFYPPEKQAEQHPEHELEWALRDGSYEEEGWRVRKDGSRFWANVVITAIRDGEGRHLGFTKVTRDTTERRAMVEELKAANRRLEEAARWQSEFLAITAHELRGPIGVLANSAETLAQHAARIEEPDRAELQRLASSSSARLRRLLAELLLAARLETSTLDLRLEPINLADVVRSSVLSVRRDHEGLDIVTSGPDDLPVLGDPGRLAQAVENLLGNAVRHGASPVAITLVSEDGAVQVRVRDSGRGVAAELRPHLFQRFASGRKPGGTGLGLYIVRELVRAHGGEATYEAEGDGPGTFVLSLPRR